MGLFSTVDLDVREAEVKASQQVVEKLLDNEEAALARLSEIEAIAETEIRYEEIAKLILECEAFVSQADELAKTITRAKKRMVEVLVTVEVGTLEEVDKLPDSKVQTKNYVLTARSNPPKVIIDELADIPKKYRKEPPPIPDWKEWEPDKNLIKSTLTSEKVEKINGVHLAEGKRLEVKQR